MSKLTKILPLAPFFALIISVAYLQGYWGYFGINVFPYLSLSELISYTTVPLFGVFASLIVGTLIGYVKVADINFKLSKRQAILEALLFISATGALFYFDIPEKWLAISLLSVALSIPLLKKIDVFMAKAKAYPDRYFVLMAYVLLVAGSFGHGRSSAAALVQLKPANVIAVIGSQSLPVHLVGKIDSYFFFLDHGKVVQHSEDVVKSIVYQKQFL